MLPHAINHAKYIFDNRVTHNNGEQWRDRIRQCNRYSPIVGVYNSRGKETDGEHRAGNATQDLKKMLVELTRGTIDGNKTHTIFDTQYIREPGILTTSGAC
jgi:hypothetical protein